MRWYRRMARRWRPRERDGEAGVVERRAVGVRPERLFVGPATIVVLLAGLVVLVVGAWRAKPIYHWFKKRQALELVDEARAAIASREWQRAMRLGLDAYRAKPDEPEVMRFMAKLGSLSADGRETALFFVRQLEAMGEAGIEERRTKVGALIALERIDEAAAAARELVARHPDDAESQLLASEALSRAGDLPGAIRRLERSVELAPDNDRYRFRLGIAKAESAFEDVRTVGRSMLWELGHGQSPSALAALLYLSDSGLVPDGAEEEFIELLENHPEAGERERMHALRWRIALDPERRRTIIDAAIEERRGMALGELLPLIEMLASLGEAETIVTAFGAEADALAAESPSMFAHYLNALVALRRWKEVVPALAVFGGIDRASAHLAHARAWATAREHRDEAIEFAKALVDNDSSRESVREFLRAANGDASEERRMVIAADDLLRDFLSDALKAAQGMDLVFEIAGEAERLGVLDLAELGYDHARRDPRLAAEAFERSFSLARRRGDSAALAALSRKVLDARVTLPSRLVEEAVYLDLLFGDRIEVLREHAGELVSAAPESSRCNLILALAEYRILDLEACHEALARVRSEDLAAGFRAVQAGLLLELGRTGEAFELSHTLPVPLLLPEERFMIRTILGRAEDDAGGIKTITTESLPDKPDS